MAAITLKNSDILVLEDETLLRKRITAFLESKGAEVIAVKTIEEAKQCLKEFNFDFAVIDVNLPDGNSLMLLKEKRFSDTTSVVVMTAEGGVDTAVEAMRLGASDYLAKPFDHEELPLVFKRSQQTTKSARREEHRKQGELPNQQALFFGDSLSKIREQLDRILETDRRLENSLPPVLIEGETGTGKTTIARWLHKEGPRASMPLVEVNCSTLPESLAESELFGHEKGAFTDARSARIGLFEAADGGTLFLDEIPSLPLPLQAKVLTAIEDRQIRRVGGNKTISVNVRLIAATNLNLKEQVKAARFREDLYHRLDLLTISIPALRERKEDLLKLTEHLLSQLGQRYKIDNKHISNQGKNRIQSYPWPGNVRELAHQIERALVMETGQSIDFVNLPNLSKNESNGSCLGKSGLSADEWFNESFTFPESGFDLETAINRIIEHAITQADGNISGAARLLGVSRDYIRYRKKAKS